MNFENNNNFLKYFSDACRKPDRDHLIKTLTFFVNSFSNFIEPDWKLIPPKRFLNFPSLPEDVLSSFRIHLWNCKSQLEKNFYEESVHLASLIIKTFLIFNRGNLMKQISNDDLISLSFELVEVIRKMHKNHPPSKDFLLDFLLFLESLHDPCYLYRESIQVKQKKKDVKEENVVIVTPLPLHDQYIPCIHALLSDLDLEDSLKTQVLSLLSSSLFASPNNALEIICPPIIDTIFKLLLSSSSFIIYSSSSSSSSSSSTSFSSFSIFKHSGNPQFFQQLLLTSSILIHKNNSFSQKKRQIEIKEMLLNYMEVVEKVINLTLELLPKDSSSFPAKINPTKNPYFSSNSSSFYFFILNSFFENFQKILEKDLLGFQPITFYLKIFQKYFFFLEKLSVTKCQSLASSIIKIINTLIIDNNKVKDELKLLIDRGKFLQVVIGYGMPSSVIIQSLIYLICESLEPIDFQFLITNNNKNKKYISIMNPTVLIMILKILKYINDYEIQALISSTILKLISLSNKNKFICCQYGVLGYVRDLFEYDIDKIDSQVLYELLDIFEILASISISGDDFKKTVRLIYDGKNLPQGFNKRFLRTLSKLGNPSDFGGHPLTFWHFSSRQSEIRTDDLDLSFPQGSTFHLWIRCQDSSDSKSELNILKVFSRKGVTLTLTLERTVLVVSLSNKGPPLRMPIQDCPLDDGQWHCLDVIQSSGKGFFGKNSGLVVLVDSIPHLESPPLSFILDEMSVCILGGRIHMPPTETPTPTSLKPSTSFFKGFFRQNSPTSSKLDSFPLEKITKSLIEYSPSKTRHFFSNTSFQLAEFIFFPESLLNSQIERLFQSGLDLRKRFPIEDDQLFSIFQKSVIWYNPKASSNSYCFNLGKSPLNAKLFSLEKGHINNLKNISGCIMTFLVLIDRIIEKPTQEDLEITDYIELLLSVLEGDLSNQREFFASDASMILGLLLNKIDGKKLDKKLLKILIKMADLFTNCHDNDLGSSLKFQFYKNLLFNFKIWSKGNILIIKEILNLFSSLCQKNKTYFRKNFGVQFLLETFHFHLKLKTLSSLNEDKESIKEIFEIFRKTMATLVGKEIKNSELDSILNMILVSEENFSIILAETLLILLEKCGRNDQIHLLMYESNKVFLFHSLLVSPKYSLAFKEKIIEIIEVLLKTNRVNEKNKHFLKITETDSYLGFLYHLGDIRDHHPPFLFHLLDQVLSNENIPQLFPTLQLCSLISNINGKIKCIEKLFSYFFSKPSLIKQFHQIPGWPEVITDMLASPMEDFSQMEKNENFENSFEIEIFSDLNSSLKNKQDSLPPSPQESDLKFFTKFSSFDDPYSTSPRSSSPISFSSLDNLSRSFSNLITRKDSHDKNNFINISFILKSLSLNSKVIPPPSPGSVEELLMLILLFHYYLAWKSNDNLVLDKNQWKIRMETIASFYSLKGKISLLKPEVALRRLFELLLHTSYTELNQIPISSRVLFSEDNLRLLEIISSYLTFSQSVDSFSELLLNLSLKLIILLTNENPSIKKSARKLELNILLLFINHPNIMISSLAVSKLHEILHSQELEIFQESCWILFLLNQAMTKTESEEFVENLLPVFETFLKKSSQLLSLSSSLPQMKNISRNFFHQFKSFQKSFHWKDFIEKQIEPSYKQFQLANFDEINGKFKLDLDQFQEDFVVFSHKRNRLRKDSINKFEKTHINPLKNRELEEISRIKSLPNKNFINNKKWNQLKKSIINEQNLGGGPAPQNGVFSISPCENDLGMRPKLIQEEISHVIRKSRKNFENNERNMEMLREASKLKNIFQEEDQLDDEEWLNIKDIKLQNHNTTEKKYGGIYKKNCEYITIREILKGTFEITPNQLIFLSSAPSRISSQYVQILLPLDLLREIHFRRYNLRRSALEFFLINKTSFFFNFDKSIRNKVYTKIIRLKPPSLHFLFTRSPAELIEASGLTQQWIWREISNFEYLMKLNTISGRTYNDLSQYPVFPWILSDYVSSNLDLNNPKVFRDLSFPVGAINPRNRKILEDKYQSLKESTSDSSECFHYGTHYSNPAGVMHYLFRLEPFTSLHVQLQDGNFDLSDRQFNSLASTWDGLMGNPNDVKELIPEFFYMPEFLININNIDLDNLQGGEERFGNVQLPLWASNPYDFIRKHREALESDYVSNHLHNWIDLIFGFKQQGLSAVESFNVFYYCTYEGAVDLDTIKDLDKKKSLEGIIKNFGQAPSQLFKTPHPKRLTKNELEKEIQKRERPVKFFHFFQNLKVEYVELSTPKRIPVFIQITKNYFSNLLQQANSETLFCITDDQFLTLNHWISHDKNNFFTFTLDKNIKKLYSVSDWLIPSPSPSNLYVATPDGRLLISGGHWDNSLRAFNTIKMKQISHINYHSDVITCLALDNLGKNLVTGSRDSTCIVWEIIFINNKSETINPVPHRVLHGNQGPISFVGISLQLDMVLSAYQHEEILVHFLKDGLFQRKLIPPQIKGYSISIERLALSLGGHCCIYCIHSKIPDFQLPGDDDQLPTQIIKIHFYSVNGTHLSSKILDSHVTHMEICEDFLIISLKNGELLIISLLSFDLISKFQLNAPITSITIPSGKSHILASLQDSNMAVIHI